MIINGHTVAVHCYAGISRSATIVIMYIMRFHRMTFNQAFAYVKEKRNCVDPNQGFLEQLKSFEAFLINYQHITN